ncbi:MAG: hypothetical protein RB292_04695 [Patescibacteria group bacterium]|nr:hypothetical protein [Patescibacteria group bacterium]
MPNLEPKYFKNALAGDQGYLPNKISQELKKAGLSSLLYGKVSQDQAIKAIRHLQDKGLVSKSKTGTQLFRQAAKEQNQDQEASRQAKIAKNVQTQIRLDLDEELAAEERGESITNYDPRSVLGKRLIDEVDRQTDRRNQKVQAEREKRDKLYNPKKVANHRPNLVDIKNLPDLDIG